MKIGDLNNILRQIFKELIDKGYPKLPMAEVTLGRSFSPQFTKFIEETDLGYIPIERMVQGLGFNLMVIPVKDSDAEFNQKIQEKYQDFIKVCKNDLLDHLDNRTIKVRVRGGSELDKLFDDFIDDFINEVEKEI